MYTGHVSTTSNRADWQETFVLTDEATGEAIDITGCRITLSVVLNRRNPNYWPYIGYPGDSFYGSAPNAGLVLTGSTDTGEITLVDVGTFQWLFTQDRMASLCQGEYQLGVRIMQNGSTMQLIIGTANVIEGFDTQ
jgi:hypothetical protein